MIWITVACFAIDYFLRIFTARFLYADEEDMTELCAVRKYMLSFVCSINYNGKILYEDDGHKNNRYILEILPKLYFIDTNRNLASFQEDLLMFQKSEELSTLRSNACMFDAAKTCNHCFSCIGLINQKKPEELQVYDTDKMLSVEADAWHEELKQLSPVEHLGNGMKGHWTGVFSEISGQTEIDFTEDVEAKKVIMKPFVKGCLKKQQEQYIADLKKAVEES